MEDVCKLLQPDYNPLGMPELKENCHHLSGYWSLQSTSFFSWENSATLPFVLYILVHDRLPFGICTAPPNHTSCVCLCPACCDFICRQCSLCIRSDSALAMAHLPDMPHCSGNLQLNPHYVILLFLFSFPSVCHSRVSWIMETQWLLLRCVINLS